ncbi:sulfite exporter TauE/SafE family protein [Marinicellulosiphila megalodicopiae]|uniref:urease accessory protein UreH domain-containing protein n=1 Tax=Marinicellulosiphila megalodicopiae TaxID=2724896 RepID=UPI003BB1A28E
MFEQSILLTALIVGLIHAFEPDHVMAVSNMHNKKGSFWKFSRYALNWAFGHGITVIVLGLIAFILNWQLSESFTGYAEWFVGIVLIVLGVWNLWNIWRKKLVLEVHSHGDIKHVHWVDSKRTHVEHVPLLVGILHGLAGSAPVLALIPMAGQSALWMSIGYLVLFSVGVVIAMTILAGILSLSHTKLAKYSQKLSIGFQGLLGVASIAIGVIWIS